MDFFGLRLREPAVCNEPVKEDMSDNDLVKGCIVEEPEVEDPGVKDPVKEDMSDETEDLDETGTGDPFINAFIKAEPAGVFK